MTRRLVDVHQYGWSLELRAGTRLGTDWALLRRPWAGPSDRRVHEIVELIFAHVAGQHVEQTVAGPVCRRRGARWRSKKTSWPPTCRPARVQVVASELGTTSSRIRLPSGV